MAAISLNDTSAEPDHKVGLLTRTIIPSPVIRWILPARIRHRRLNDVVFVGEDFIEVKQVRSGGHVEPIISKRDLGSRICSAKVFTIEDAANPIEDDIFQHNIDYKDLPSPVLPAQLLVLTLESNALIFLYLARQDDGTVQFRHQFVPLPRWPDALRQPGELLAIDPQSRAMAIASRGGQIILYAAKDRQTFADQLASGSEEWCPVDQQIHSPVSGSIQHISFLHPQRSHPEHVILLVVVTDPAKKRTRLTWVDWQVASGPHELQKHEPVPIRNSRCVSSLLIPLCNTNFLIVNGKSVFFYKDLISGTPTDAEKDAREIDRDHPPEHPAISPKYPIWTNWCRPMRSPSAAQDQDSVYLCREDGTVFHLVISQDGNIHSSCAGVLGCHVGEAFASLGDDRNPDLLAAAADMSTGRIVSIGNWPSHRAPGRTRRETMDMKLVELLPNWTSVTDMVVAKASSSNSRSGRSRDSVFLTSGRQPYGTITEIRKGLEARMLTYVPLPDLRSMLDVWALPDPPNGSIILLLSTPASTVVYKVSGDIEEIEVETEYGIFDLENRTLGSDITESNQLVQITEKRIIVAGSVDAAFEDKEELVMPDGHYIVCTAIEPKLDLVVSCKHTPEGPFLIAHTCPRDSDSDDTLILPGPTIKLDSRPLCIASALSHDSALVLVADETGTIQAFASAGKTIESLGHFSLDEDIQTPCDQMVLLRSDDDHFLAVCSSRDGKLITVPITTSSFTTSTPTQRPFGLSTIKLRRMSSERDRAYAMCGPDTCLLTIRGVDDIEIRNIWTTDNNRPDLLQNNIYGCARLPHPDFLSSNGGLNTLGRSLVMISAEELWIATLAPNTSTVPRQIGVSGSPGRLACAHMLTRRSLLCASILTEVTDDENRRRHIPAIQCISLRDNSMPAKHTMEPGDEVYSLLEWSPTYEEKSYQFVLVGGRYLKNGSTQNERGRITFLQPNARDGFRVQYALSLDDPVYALALYDEYTFAVCYGRCIALYRFLFDSHRVKPICAPIEFASPGAAITCQAPMIHITTRADSIVTLLVEETPTGSPHPARLVISSIGPRIEVGISHAIVRTTSGNDIAVMSTREKQIVGFSLPQHDAKRLGRSADLLFEATLPQSITRVRKCDIRPAWQAKPSDNVLVDGIVGCCTDGSLVGLAVINQKLWRQLFWMQRLCEWSADVSPHSSQQPMYSVLNEDEMGHDRALPIGLTGSSDIMLAAPDDQLRATRDMHIDGDVLARLLDRGGALALRGMIEKVAKRQDHVGEWVRSHLELELAAVESCVAEASILLNSWF
ncbi:hypothetical protein AMS68_005921 [Peltaster fructicola]|uniref:RSE1/DDB1/CPSF1 first beta-propeller domain-containing protein n=1 Tax=Peltaster fructicola TaxID=286661 RepID=A0A6H0Y079_9PEZI|nr:hypothetical protein AMS68_005921 [Peltaster fructicola]